MLDLSNKNIIHINKEGIQYIQFKKLLEYQDDLVHGFALKELDFGSNDTMVDNKLKFIQNYQKICNVMNIDYNKIIRPYQTHTDVVETVNNEVEEISIFSEEYKNVDGLVTNKSNIILSLGYADCIPLFFFDPVKKVIANIHSGWKGTLKRIGVRAVQKMIKEYRCNPKNIICCIGPSIGKCHFEVEEDVYKYFKDEFTKIESEVMISKIDNKGIKKYNIDTVKINRSILEQIGLKKENIIESGICTVCNYNLVHSYRAEKEKSGRNTALIMLK